MQFDNGRTRPAQNRVVVVSPEKPFLRVLRRPISYSCKRVRCSVQVVSRNKYIQIRRWSHARIRVESFTKYGSFEANRLDTSCLEYAQHIVKRLLDVGLPNVPNDQPAFGTLSQFARKTDSGIRQTTVEIALNTL